MAAAYLTLFSLGGGILGLYFSGLGSYLRLR